MEMYEKTSENLNKNIFILLSKISWGQQWWRKMKYCSLSLKWAFRGHILEENLISEEDISEEDISEEDILRRIFWGGYSEEDILRRIFWGGHSEEDILRGTFRRGHSEEDILRRTFWGGHSEEDISVEDIYELKKKNTKSLYSCLDSCSKFLVS